MTPDQVDAAASSLERVGGGYAWIAAWVRHMNTTTKENTSMRILTVRQPWADAILHAGKNVENRARNIAGDYRGPIAIHASKSIDAGARFPLATVVDLPDEGPVLGAILGVVDLVDVHRGYRQDDPFAGEPDEYCDIPSVIGPHPKRCSPWAEPNDHHLVLANPRPLPTPIPYRGALGLRHLDDTTITTITAALAAEGRTL